MGGRWVACAGLAGTSLWLGVCGGDWPRPKAGRFPLARGPLEATPARGRAKHPYCPPCVPALCTPRTGPWRLRVRPESHLRRERPQQRRQLEPEPEPERQPRAGSPGCVLHSRGRTQGRPGPSLPPGDSAVPSRPEETPRWPGQRLGPTSFPRPSCHIVRHTPQSRARRALGLPGRDFTSKALRETPPPARCRAVLSSLLSFPA